MNRWLLSAFLLLCLFGCDPSGEQSPPDPNPNPEPDPDPVVILPPETVTKSETELPSCPDQDLVAGMLALVNAARAEARLCGNDRYEAAPPLTSDSLLDSAAKTHSQNMANANFFAHEGINGDTVGERVTAQEYRWQTVGENLAGGQPTMQEAVGDLLDSPGHCKNLMNPAFTQLGTACETNADADYIIYWTQVFAAPREQPLEASRPDEASCPQSLGGMLELVNAARSEARFCGGDWYEAAPALTANTKLDDAAYIHSANMAQDNFFAHEGIDGDTVGDRVTAQAYVWQTVGENLAGGQPTMEEAVDALLASPGHCRNLMNPGFTQLGAACEINPGADLRIYWTQVFATPREQAPLGAEPTCPDPIDMLTLVNQARAKPRKCGGTRYAAAPPLSLDAALVTAALLHSDSMASEDYFGHQGRDGSNVGDRVTAQGYTWQMVGQNLAAGYTREQQVIDAWLTKPDHCSNLMDPDYRHMGAACRSNPETEHKTYWTQILATKQN